MFFWAAKEQAGKISCERYVIFFFFFFLFSNVIFNLGHATALLYYLDDIRLCSH